MLKCWMVLWDHRSEVGWCSLACSESSFKHSPTKCLVGRWFIPFWGKRPILRHFCMLLLSVSGRVAPKNFRETFCFNQITQKILNCLKRTVDLFYTTNDPQQRWPGHHHRSWWTFWWIMWLGLELPGHAGRSCWWKIYGEPVNWHCFSHNERSAKWLYLKGNYVVLKGPIFHFHVYRRKST